MKSSLGSALRSRGRWLYDRIVQTLGDASSTPERASSVGILAAAVATARLLALLASIGSARILGVTEFGAFGMLQATVAMFQAFAGPALSETAARYIAFHSATDPGRAARATRVVMGASHLVAAGAALTIVFFADDIARRLGTPSIDAMLLRIAAPIVFGLSLASAHLGVITGLQAIETAALLTIVSALLPAVGSVAGAALAGLRGAVIGTAAAAIVSWLLAAILAARTRRERDFGKSTDGLKFDDWRVLSQFTLPALAAGLVVIPVHWYCSALLLRAPGGVESFGVFNAANGWLQVLMFAPAVAGYVAVPSLATSLGVGDNSHAAGLAWRAVRTTFRVSLWIAIPTALASPLIMRLYGPQFRGGVSALLLVLSTGVLVATASPVGHYISALGRMWLGLAINLLWASVYVVGTYALLRFGEDGLAGARLIAYTVLAAVLIMVLLSSIPSKRAALGEKI